MGQCKPSAKISRRPIFATKPLLFFGYGVHLFLGFTSKLTRIVIFASFTELG